MERLVQRRQSIDQPVISPLCLCKDSTAEGVVVNKSLLALLRLFCHYKLTSLYTSVCQEKLNWFCLRIRIIGVGSRLEPVVILTDDPCPWIIFDIILNAEKIPGKPFVHQAERRLSSMAALVEIYLHGNAFLLQYFYEAYTVTYHDIPVIESMSHQCCSLVILHVIHQVALCPEVAVVTCSAVDMRHDSTIPVNTVAVGAVIRVGMDKVVKDVDILSEICLLYTSDAADEED